MWTVPMNPLPMTAVPISLRRAMCGRRLLRGRAGRDANGLDDLARSGEGVRCDARLGRATRRRSPRPPATQHTSTLSRAKVDSACRRPHRAAACMPSAATMDRRDTGPWSVGSDRARSGRCPRRRSTRSSSSSTRSAWGARGRAASSSPARASAGRSSPQRVARAARPGAGRRGRAGAQHRRPAAAPADVPRRTPATCSSRTSGATIDRRRA